MLIALSFKIFQMNNLMQSSSRVMIVAVERGGWDTHAHTYVNLVGRSIEAGLLENKQRD